MTSLRFNLPYIILLTIATLWFLPAADEAWLHAASAEPEKTNDHPAALLNVPYYCQEDTQWCFFNCAAMILRYYQPQMAHPENAKKPWEIAANYTKAADKTFNTGDQSLADYINRLAPELKAEGGWVLNPLDSLRPYLEEKIRSGKPVLVGKGGLNTPVVGRVGLGHAVLVVGVGEGGLWINNPGHFAPELPFLNNSGIHTFLAWEEFDRLFSGPVPRYKLCCNAPPEKTNQDAVGLGEMTIQFFRCSPGSIDVIENLAWDGMQSHGYRWQPASGTDSTIPQNDVAVQIQIGVGNSAFGERRGYSVSLELAAFDGTVVQLKNIAIDPLEPGQFQRTTGGDIIPLPPTPGGKEALRIVLRDSTGAEILDQCEFFYERSQRDERLGLLDAVFCIDTTGSMADDIDAVKKSSTEIIAQLKRYCDENNISLQVGLVTYQDHADAERFKGAPEAEWLKAWPMSSKPDVIKQSVLAIPTPKLAVGGDVEEDAYAAYMCAMDARPDWEGKPVKMGWRQGAAKILIPMCDAPPHEPDFEKRTLEIVSARAEELDPVHFYPLLLPKSAGFFDPTARALRRLADATGGEVVRVNDASALPQALVDTVKLAIRRHRNEVWRKENPPYVLYVAIGVMLATVILTTIAIGIGAAAGRKRERQ